MKKGLSVFRLYIYIYILKIFFAHISGSRLTEQICVEKRVGVGVKYLLIV
jgi:hypothetical protein